MDEVTADKTAAACDHQIVNIHVAPFPPILTSIFAVKLRFPRLYRLASTA
jgi:hypothetical protein